MLTEAERLENRRQLEALAAEICTMAGHINAANYRWLTLIAEFDRRNGWADNCTQSCAHWLNWKCGIGMGAAREKVRVARALEDLPIVSAAMECGALSYSKVRAITRVACSNTEERTSCRLPRTARRKSYREARAFVPSVRRKRRNSPARYDSNRIDFELSLR